MEKLDIYNIQGKPTGKTKTRGDVFSDIIYDDYIVVYDFDTELAVLQPEEVSEIK